MVEQRLFSQKRKFSSLDEFESILNFVKFINASTSKPEMYLDENYQ